VLGRKPVIERQHHSAGTVGEPPAHPVVRIQAANRPATAMEVDDQRQPAGRGAVQPRSPLARLQVSRWVHLGPGRSRSRALFDPFAHPGYVEVADRWRLRQERSELIIGKRPGQRPARLAPASPLDPSSRADATARRAAAQGSLKDDQDAARHVFNVQNRSVRRILFMFSGETRHFLPLLSLVPFGMRGTWSRSARSPGMLATI
jgi:hypothetical protein